MSNLESCLDAVDHFTLGDDGDALMGSDRQQVLAIPGDDLLGARRDGRRDHMIVIVIVGHHSRHAGRNDQYDQQAQAQ